MVDLNGNTWPQQWVDVYNGLTARIDATKNPWTRESLLDERHRFYVLCTIVLSEGIC